MRKHHCWFLALALVLGTSSTKSLAASDSGLPVNPQANAADSQAICKIDCVEPHAACSESAKVIETLQLLVKALSKGDLETYGQYLDDGCTTFDEHSKKLVVGKQAVLDDLKRKFAEHGPNSDAPLISFTIDHPYAHVTGDTAVVTFLAIKEFGGKQPAKLECHATDVFVKHGDIWKKLHYRGAWKKVS